MKTMIERQTINIDNFLQKDRSSKYPKYCFLSSSAALTSQCTFYQEKIQAQQRVNFFIQSQRQLSTILCSDWMKQFFFILDETADSRLTSVPRYIPDWGIGQYSSDLLGDCKHATHCAAAINTWHLLTLTIVTSTPPHSSDGKHPLFQIPLRTPRRVWSVPVSVHCPRVEICFEDPTTEHISIHLYTRG